MKRVIGVDFIGIGGDYDGCSQLPRGLEDVSCYPNLTAELLYRGYTEEDIAKILCGNILRVLEAAEVVRDDMDRENVLPSEATIKDLDGGDIDASNNNNNYKNSDI